MQFTSLTTIAFADVTPAQQGAATTISSMLQQLAQLLASPSPRLTHPPVHLYLCRRAGWRHADGHSCRVPLHAAIGFVSALRFWHFPAMRVRKCRAIGVADTDIRQFAYFRFAATALMCQFGAATNLSLKGNKMAERRSHWSRQAAAAWARHRHSGLQPMVSRSRSCRRPARVSAGRRTRRFRCHGSNQSNSDLKRLVDGALERWGHIDALVNSAGHGPRKGILEITDEDWHAGIDVYFLNAVRPTRLVTPVMQQQKSGVIINISTAWAFEAERDVPDIGGRPQGLASFTKIFADTYAPENIRMNNVLPGWIDSLPATDERRDSVPLGRYGKSRRPLRPCRSSPPTVQPTLLARTSASTAA